MPETPERQFDTRLLELHLGHLSVDEQLELRRQIAADARLAAQDEALASVFRALEAVRAEPAPRGLAARVLERVREAGPMLRIIPRPAARAAGGQRDVRPIFLGRLRDILAVAAVLVLALGLGVPGVLRVRERQQRIGCTWNIAQIGKGIQQYAGVFKGSLPFAGFGQGDSYQATGDPQVVMVPNRRHVYPLLLLAYVRDPRAFVCPAQPHVPMPQQEIPRHHDFLENRNVSYAYQNMAGVRPSANDDPRLPILADDNPLFQDGRLLLDLRRFALGDAAADNSHAHRGAGQNILTLDGHVMWTTTPLCGINGDNIWVLRGVREYTGREGPLAATDSHLLK